MKAKPFSRRGFLSHTILASGVAAAMKLAILPAGFSSFSLSAEEVVLGRISVAPSENFRGPHRCATSPSVSAAIREAQESGAHLVLIDANGRSIPAQWSSTPLPPRPDPESELAGTGELVWFSPNPADHRLWRVVARSTPDPAATALSIREAEGRFVEIYLGDKPVLRFNHGIVRQHPDRDGPYDRAGYLHPVWTPAGHVVTGDFSPEHAHQRGLFWAWRSVTSGEVKSDFWGLGEATGRMLPAVPRPDVEVGPVFAQLEMRNTGMIGDRPALRERVRIRVYAEPARSGWLVDIAIRQSAASREPTLRLNRYHYGGMAFRGPTHWLSADSGEVVRAREQGVAFDGDRFLTRGTELLVLTDEGRTRQDGNETTARWVDYSGPFTDGWGGVAVFDHPANGRFPTPVRIHPELPYFSYAFVQREPYEFADDKPLRLTYRLVVHDGPPDAEENEAVSISWTAPPAATWQPVE